MRLALLFVLLVFVVLAGVLIVNADAGVDVECGASVVASPFGGGLMVAHTNNALVTLYDASGVLVEAALYYWRYGKSIDDEEPKAAQIAFEDGSDAVIENYPALPSGEYLAVIESGGAAVYQRLHYAGEGGLLLAVECYTSKYWDDLLKPPSQAQ